LRKISQRNCSQKYLIMENPFKFGSIVQGEYFTNRIKEIDEIANVISSKNHLIIISPRRFGKTSLIKKVLNQTKHKQIFLTQLENQKS